MHKEYVWDLHIAFTDENWVSFEHFFLNHFSFYLVHIWESWDYLENLDLCIDKRFSFYFILMSRKLCVTSFESFWNSPFNFTWIWFCRIHYVFVRTFSSYNLPGNGLPNWAKYQVFFVVLIGFILLFFY